MGIRFVGPTLAAAFEQVALAMTAVVTDRARVAPALAGRAMSRHQATRQ